MCFTIVLVTLAAVSVESLPQFFQPQFGFQRQVIPVYSDGSVFVDRRSLPQHSFDSPNYNQDFKSNFGQYPQYESLKIQPSESFERTQSSVVLPEYDHTYKPRAASKVQGQEQFIDYNQNDYASNGPNTQLNTAQNVRNINSQNNNCDERPEIPISRHPIKETRPHQKIEVTTKTYQINNDYSPTVEQQHRQIPNASKLPNSNLPQNNRPRPNKTEQNYQNNNYNIETTTPYIRQEEYETRFGDNKEPSIHSEYQQNSNTYTIKPNPTDADSIYSNVDKTKSINKQDKDIINKQHGSTTSTSRPYTTENETEETYNADKRGFKNGVKKPYFDSKPNQDAEVPEGKDESDRWIWGVTGVTETEAPLTMSSVDLDDRASFDGTMCPADKVKVQGMCVKVDT